MAIDKIGSKALTDCSVAAADIAPGTITTTKLAGSITNAKLANSTVTINGTAVALGASASIAALAWQSVVVSDGSTVTTMVAGRGYFVNNTSAAGIVKLPISASAGDTVAIKDYAGNFGTNKLTIQRNGHKIQGVTNDSLIGTNRASIVLVYIDATKGWLYTNESNVADLQSSVFIAATGGTVATSGDFKIHSFTGDGNFVVSNGGNSVGSNKVSYVVVAGGAAGGVANGGGGGGGAGGYREGKAPSFDSYSASPLAAPDGLTITAQTYPITVGAGGSGGTSPNSPGGSPAFNGNNSVFSTITSTAGGGGASGNTSPNTGTAAGSGGGGGKTDQSSPGAGAAGNTPPVSPPQGNNGGTGGFNAGGGGGGASAVGGNATSGSNPSNGGVGGAGIASSITGSAVTRAGGGGGNAESGTGGAGGSGGGQAGGSGGASSGVSGQANTGGGGGGADSPGGGSGSGGKGIVIIRYKFQ